MVRHVLLCILFIWCFPTNDAKGYCDYCGPDVCNNTKQHTLCLYQSEDPARHCLECERTIKTWKDRQEILDKLNSRRNKVAAGDIRSLPPAEGMMKLEWNEELEASAQRWANQCVKHSVPDVKDTCRDLGGVYVGQSIATIAGEAPGLTPAALVDVWYMELLNINASVLPRYQPSAVTGYSNYDYFTQLVWAESSEVGCGAVKFKERVPDINRARNRTIYRLVCNFAPGGNRVNRSVYTEGLPCSRCPGGGNCDSIYKALCVPKIQKKRTAPKSQPIKIANTKIFNATTTRKISSTHATTTETVTTATTSTAEENFTIFDYFPHLHEFVRPSLTTSTSTASPCKDVSAIEDFIELLKKKLGNDPLFKDLVITTRPPGIDMESDPNVAAFVSKLYSRKTTPQSTTVSADYVNSTLLVDLVEAVIFRSGDKTRTTYGVEHTIQHISDVSAVKVQAELAEVQRNADFTGHYFFPEDVSEDSEASTETTDSYYDSTSPHVADVVKEIEDMKRTKHTKDFLDDILDSESNIEKEESVKPSTDVARKDDSFGIEHSSFGIEQKRMKRDDGSRQESDLGRKVRRLKSFKNLRLKSFETSYAKFDYRSCHVKYNDLLKKLATDLSILKLNERFHCVNSSHSLELYSGLVIVLLLLYLFCILI